MCTSVTKNLKAAAAAFSADKDCWHSLETHRFHNGWKTPLCAEKSFAVETSLFVDISVQNVHTDHTGVHGVGILLHSSLGHRFPRMAVVEGTKMLEIRFKRHAEIIVTN